MTEASNEVAANYERRRAAHAAAGAALAVRSSRLANLRLLLFLGAVACAVIGLWQLDQPRLIPLVGAGLSLLAFIVSAVIHGRTITAQRRAEVLAAICSDALARLLRDWDALAVPGAGRAGEQALAVDLDLFGPASLFQLLGTAQTPPGRATLAAWLLDPAAPEEIRARQAAVAELAQALDFRQELERLGRPLGEAEPDVEPFLAWAESEPWLMQRPWLIWLSRLLPAVLIALLVADGLDWIPSVAWLPLPILNLLLTALVLGRSKRAFERLSAGDLAFAAYADLFAFASEATFSAERLQPVLGGLGRSGARRQMQRLERIQGFCDLRRSTMAHLPAQAFLLWDFHCWLALERWQRTAGRQVRDWFRLLGEFEALCALAALAGDHPDWSTQAEIGTGGEASIEAEDLGHPLLPASACVRNPVGLGPAGTFLLVTGSNMSGKSTLLRAVGVNLILAQAGGPVCARRLRLPPAVLGTSFRIRDSLAQGVSYFMAELQHLKRVVDLARRVEAEGQRVLVYLFDEILLGTNVVERQVAVRRVLEHLLALGAVGAIATHDLHLAEAGPLASAKRSVHFRERFEEKPDGQQGMSFDFVLRPGLAPTTNALKLLELVGLAAQCDDGSEPA